MTINSTVAALHALAHETRLRSLQELARAGDGGLTAGVLAKRLDVQKNALSPHLSLLQRSELVTSEKSGRNITYRVRAEALVNLSNGLRAMVGKASTID